MQRTKSDTNLIPTSTDGDFWFPVNSSTVGPLPPSSQGHSAAFDHENKVVYVYGGFRDGQRYSDIYMLDTLTWKWKLIKVSSSRSAKSSFQVAQ